MKKILLTTLAIALFAFANNLNAQIINTIAGNGTVGSAGNGGAATSCEFWEPENVAVDAAGNVYISDAMDDCIRKINTSGIISAVAGNTIQGFSGDGGLATSAEFYSPKEIAIDDSGNIYVADQANYRIRKINTSGIITTFAGNGNPVFSGDGGPAIDAGINSPSGVAVDAAGNVYITDNGNFRIRKVNTSGIISTIAGNGTEGYSGDGGAATSAQLFAPVCIALDNSGNIYINDHSCIRKINTSGIISTIIGNGTAGYSGDGGLATSAEIGGTFGIAIDATGNIYFSDYGNYRIREVNTSGIINTVAGNGFPGFSGDGGLATLAEMDEPYGIALDSSGDLYIADSPNYRIREITGLTGISENNFSNASISVFPNPSNGIFNVVQKNNFQKSSLEIYNVLGEKIISTTLTASQTPIDLSNKAKGVYFYKVVSEDGKNISEGKLVVQ